MMSLKTAKEQLKFIEDQIAAKKRLVAQEEARQWPEGTSEIKTHWNRREAAVMLPKLEKAAAEGRAWIAQHYPDSIEKEG